MKRLWAEWTTLIPGQQAIPTRPSVPPSIPCGSAWRPDPSRPQPTPTPHLVQPLGHLLLNLAVVQLIVLLGLPDSRVHQRAVAICEPEGWRVPQGAIGEPLSHLSTRSGPPGNRYWGSPGNMYPHTVPSMSSRIRGAEYDERGGGTRMMYREGTQGEAPPPRQGFPPS